MQKILKFNMKSLILKNLNQGIKFNLPQDNNIRNQIDLSQNNHEKDS